MYKASRDLTKLFTLAAVLLLPACDSGILRIEEEGVPFLIGAAPDEVDASVRAWCQSQRRILSVSGDANETILLIRGDSQESEKWVDERKVYRIAIRAVDPGRTMAVLVGYRERRGKWDGQDEWTILEDPVTNGDDLFESIAAVLDKNADPSQPEVPNEDH